MKAHQTLKLFNLNLLVIILEEKKMVSKKFVIVLN